MKGHLGFGSPKLTPFLLLQGPFASWSVSLQSPCLTHFTNRAAQRGVHEMEDLGKRKDQHFSWRAQTASPSKCQLN